MTQQEVKTWMEHAIRDHWYLSQLRFNAYVIDEMAGQKDFYRRSVRFTQISRIKLEIVSLSIYRVEERSLLFREGTTRYPIKKNFTPPEDPPVRKRLSLAEGWTPFCKCMSCGGNKWLPVSLNEQDYVACYSCIPPSQHVTIGASEQPFSLLYRWANNNS